MAKPCLQRPRVMTGIGQGEAAAVPQHVRVHRERHSSPFADPGKQAMKCLRRLCSPVCLAVTRLSLLLFLSIAKPPQNGMAYLGAAADTLAIALTYATDSAATVMPCTMASARMRPFKQLTC
jgi:hypothetical protein